MRQGEVAARHSLNDRTIRRKLADPRFQDLVAKHQADIFKGALSQLTAGAREAAITLRSLLRSPNEATRLKTSTAILANLVDLAAFSELRDRVQALEARMPGISKRRHT